MRRERMAKRVAARRLVNPSIAHRSFDRALQQRLCDMVTALVG
jgi:hypothetical protein